MGRKRKTAAEVSAARKAAVAARWARLAPADRKAELEPAHAARRRQKKPRIDPADVDKWK